MRILKLWVLAIGAIFSMILLYAGEIKTKGGTVIIDNSSDYFVLAALCPLFFVIYLQTVKKEY